MYAIVRIGGRQYPVEAGKTILVEKLPYEAGETLELDDVLLIGEGDKTYVGKPAVAGAIVQAEVVGQTKGKKVVVFKYKPKVRYRRKQGHRQNYTRLLIQNIVVGK